MGVWCSTRTDSSSEATVVGDEASGLCSSVWGRCRVESTMVVSTPFFLGNQDCQSLPWWKTWFVVS
jgi:hypothetical protein